MCLPHETPPRPNVPAGRARVTQAGQGHAVLTGRQSWARSTGRGPGLRPCPAADQSSRASRGCFGTVPAHPNRRAGAYHPAPEPHPGEVAHRGRQGSRTRLAPNGPVRSPLPFDHPPPGAVSPRPVHHMGRAGRPLPGASRHAIRGTTRHCGRFCCGRPSPPPEMSELLSGRGGQNSGHGWFPDHGRWRRA